MTSPVIPAPAGLLPAAHTRASTAELPAARAAELGVALLDHGAELLDHGAELLDHGAELLDHGPALAISLVECAPDERTDGRTDDGPDGPDGPAELRVAGEVDLLTVAQLRFALDHALGRARHAVVVDLRGVSFIDCTGIGVLVEARRRAQRRGVGLQIVPGRAVARVAALLDLGATLGLDEPRQ